MDFAGLGHVVCSFTSIIPFPQGQFDRNGEGVYFGRMEEHYRVG